MKLRKAVMVTQIIGLCFGFGCNQGDVKGTKEVQKVTDVQGGDVKEPVLTVLNPLGTPPPIKLKAMAPRLDTLEGKTIYVDNDGFPGTSVLLPELIKVMKEKYPTTKFIYHEKPAGTISTTEDPAAGKADAMIVATGH